MRAILHQALFILNFLNLLQGDILTGAEIHFVNTPNAELAEKNWAKIAIDALWQRALLMVKGRGYGLVSLQDRRQLWLPGRWIRARKGAETEDRGVTSS